MMQQTESLFGQATPRPIHFRSADRSWRSGPSSPAIWPNEVHVWKIYLKTPGLCDNREILSTDERVRASRFRFHTDSDRFIAARSSLRIVLARYLRTRPAGIEFGVNSFGKPHLTGSRDELGLRFNLSHSHDMALLAVARNRDVGVDVEFRRADFATDEIAQRFFSRSEQNQLRATAPEKKTEAFFNCWTRKEAYIKARGEGLSFPLDQFDVSFAPDAPPALLGNRLDPAEVGRWSFEELSPADGYAAALSVEGNFSRLLLWDFPGKAN
jgi:4'-phosphopantetheinyl transferase